MVIVTVVPAAKRRQWRVLVRSMRERVAEDRRSVAIPERLGRSRSMRE